MKKKYESPRIVDTIKEEELLGKGAVTAAASFL
jgi:hypothetical protein